MNKAVVKRFDEVYENRMKKLDDIEKMNQVEEIVLAILDVFEASNNEECNLLIRQILIHLNENQLKCMISREECNAIFWDLHELQQITELIKIESAITKVEKIQLLKPDTVIEDIYCYVEKGINDGKISKSKYSIAKDGGHVKIRMLY